MNQINILTLSSVAIRGPCVIANNFEYLNYDNVVTAKETKSMRHLFSMNNLNLSLVDPT
jgi:hypothetical protein